MIVPILILTKERPTMLMDMVESIEQNTDNKTYEIIICDNASQQPAMIKLLNELKSRHTVIVNKSNMLFEGLNPGLGTVKQKGYEYFIISDPDIMLKTGIPRKWIMDLVSILENTSYPKVGLALNLEFNKRTPYTEKIRQLQDVHWAIPVNLTDFNAPCYEAVTDTTLCIYRRDTYKYWNNDELLFDLSHGVTKEGWIDSINFQYNEKYRGIALRIAGKYTAEHLGWYVDRRYDEDFYNYKNSSKAMDISSSFGDSLFRLLLNDIEGREGAPTNPDSITPELMEKYGLPKDYNQNHPWWNQPSYKEKWNRMIRKINVDNC